MKIGEIVKPNTKGQVVIPKDYREKLGIVNSTWLNIIPRGGGLYIVPIKGISQFAETEDNYYNTLLKTKGAWGKEDNRKDQEKRKLELDASKERRKKW
jgi:AbrB family looped-hinge helix DNA binding protein